MIELRPDLKDFKPYKPEDSNYIIKLDANESPFSMPDSVKQKFIAWFMEYSGRLYPDSNSTKLREAIAKFYNTDKNCVICGVGSDQIIDYIIKAYIGENDLVMTLNPTFSMYKLTTKINHGKVEEIDLSDTFDIEMDTLIEKVNQKQPKILFICSPNNPTGKSFKKFELQKLVASISCLLVIDEAYAEFTNETMIESILAYDNLLILKTFSKAYGMAGARVGYALSNERIIEDLNIVKEPYNLSAMSEALAIFALEDYSIFKKRIAEIVELRDMLFEELRNLSPLIKAFKSDANFIFIKTDDSLNIYESLKKHGIYVRNMSKENGKYIRITVGTSDENKILLDCLKKELKGGANENPNC